MIKKITIKLSAIGLWLALLMYLAFICFFNISEVPGFHYNEAFFAERAIKINEFGIQSIHGLNKITSPIYSIILSYFFKIFGASIYVTRALTVSINIIASFIVASFIYIRFSWIQSLCYLLFLSSSSYFILYARKAIEVCALNHLFISIKVILLYSIIKNNKASFLTVFFLYLILMLGCLNHFIFIGVVLSFFITSCAFQNMNKDENQAILPVSFWAMILTLCLYFIKPSISDAFFQKNKLNVYFLFLSLPILCSFCYKFSFQKIYVFFWWFKKIIQRKMTKHFYKKIVQFLIFFVFAGSVVSYLPVYIGYMSNIFPMMKFFSTSGSWFFKFNGFLFVFIVSFLFFKEAKYFCFNDKYSKNNFVLFVLLLTIIYFSIFMLTTARPKLRYLLMFNSFFMFTSCLIINRFRPFLIFSLVISSFVLHRFLVAEIQEKKTRRPIVFKIDHRKAQESSFGFVDTQDLYQNLKKKNICQFASPNREILYPLSFYKLQDSFHCDNKKVANCKLTLTQPFYSCEIH